MFISIWKACPVWKGYFRFSTLLHHYMKWFTTTSNGLMNHIFGSQHAVSEFQEMQCDLINHPSILQSFLHQFHTLNMPLICPDNIPLVDWSLKQRCKCCANEAEKQIFLNKTSGKRSLPIVFYLKSSCCHISHDSCQNFLRIKWMEFCHLKIAWHI
jgi:hypothetical protein